MKLIMSTRFGSSLYGTNTESSDTDIKAVAIPSREEVLLGKIPATPFRFETKKGEEKNTSDDIDCEVVGLHKFIREACEGQTYAFDMLHAPDNKKYFTSQIWKDLEANRSKFYTKNITATVDYCKGQADKYGIKGSRLSDARIILDWFDEQIKSVYTGEDHRTSVNTRIMDCDLSTFPKGEHITWHFSPGHNYVIGEDKFQGTDMVEVCNRKILLNSKLGYARDVVQKIIDNYGVRAEKAAKNEGVDWKAMSHAVRAAVQVRAILLQGRITYPLPEADVIRDIKLGKYKYDMVACTLEDLIDEIKTLSSFSKLPEKPDMDFWNKWLMNIIDEYSVKERYFKRIVT